MHSQTGNEILALEYGTVQASNTVAQITVYSKITLQN